jgi:hypothetical protein
MVDLSLLCLPMEWQRSGEFSKFAALENSNKEPQMREQPVPRQGLSRGVE